MLMFNSLLRILMPPPPPLFAASAPVARKRQRDAATEDPVGVPVGAASVGMHFSILYISERLLRHFFCRVVCCMKRHLPPCGGMGEEWRPV